MENKLITDLSDSAFDFQRVVFPKLRDREFIDGEVISIEVATSDYMKGQLDMQAGIDAWIIKDGIGITGLASQIQWQKPIEM